MKLNDGILPVSSFYRHFLYKFIYVSLESVGFFNSLEAFIHNFEVFVKKIIQNFACVFFLVGDA